MRTKIFYALLFVFALSGCRRDDNLQQNLKPVFSQISTDPGIVVQHRNVTYSCDVTNFDPTYSFTKTYIKIGYGYPLEQRVVDGQLSTTGKFYCDTTITFMASYWDYNSQEYKYVEQVYEVKPLEPSFRTFVLGDELDYIYSMGSSHLDYSNPEQRGESLRYGWYAQMGADEKKDDFDFYDFTQGVMSGAGLSFHYDPQDVLTEFGQNYIGYPYGFTGCGFNRKFFMNMVIQPIEVVYVDGFTPTDEEALAIDQVASNGYALDDNSLEIVANLLLDNKVQFNVEVVLTNYPDLRFVEHVSVYDYTPEGQVTKDYTLSQK